MFSVVEELPRKYMESPLELNFVTEIEKGETPHKDDTLVIKGAEFQVTGVERNYDTETVIVYVSRKVKYDDIFEM